MPTHPARLLQRLTSPALTVALAVTLALTLTGCHVDHQENGSKQDVKIATPFGGMSVKTNDADVQGSLGLDTYPGAAIVDKHDGKDGAADVNLSFGDFHLGVKAVSYTTPDAPDKVLAFYRKALARYGPVILCNGSVPVGSPTATPEGLTCNDGHRDTVHLDEEGNRGELKAGSKLHQHIVAVDAKGSGSKFAVVALDLPKGLDRHDSGEDKQ